LSKLGRYDQAAGDFDAVLAQDPDNARAHNQRGLAYAAEGSHDEAIAAFTEALRLAPDFDAAFFNRGSAYRNKGDHDQAIGEFTEFLRRRSQHAPAYYQRGLAYLAQKDFDLAIADFNRAVQLDPNLTQSYMSCLEATRAKYEAKSAPPEEAPPPRAVAPRVVDVGRPTPLPPAPLAAAKSVAAGAAIKGPRSETRSEASGPTVDNRPAADPTLTPVAHIDPEVPAGKLPITCPECETVGLLDLRNLGKKFRCPGCNIWWRTTAAGNLEQTDEPSEPTAAAPVVKGPPTATSKAPVKAAKPPAKPTASQPTRRKQESGVAYTGLWLAAVARTKTARWVVVVGVLVFAALIPVLFPSLFPSELRSRGQKVAQSNVTTAGVLKS
jgi:regulator of sirC expression with transglutaminase-like and TPR domain